MNALERGFGTFSKCAYRLELLPQYSIYDTNEYSEFVKYINGEVINGFANQEWLDCLTKWTNEGKTIERIRVVPQVITDYFRYEFLWCYPRNIECGEKITFITFEEFASICEGIKINDFWAFDNEMVVSLIYNDKYEFDNCLQLPDNVFPSHLNLFRKMQSLAVEYNQCKNRIKWNFQ